MSIQTILKQFKKGLVSEKEILKVIKKIPFSDIEFAKVDHHRVLRRGIPEVIFCEGKTQEQVVRIAEDMYAHHGFVFATRAHKKIFTILQKKFTDICYNELGKVIIIGKNKHQTKKKKTVAIITAGTSDINTAEEAYMTTTTLGSTAIKIYDVGVAGIHRLFRFQDTIENANVLIVIAGMEGALPSVVSGITSKPIIAVPTSKGYGTALGGITALFAMLNSCSPGVTVVNIDNGFGAGYFAHMINN